VQVGVTFRFFFLETLRQGKCGTMGFSSTRSLEDPWHFEIFDFTSHVFKIVWWIVPYNFNIRAKSCLQSTFFNLGLQYIILSPAGNQKKISMMMMMVMVLLMSPEENTIAE
jgi:hypothetical protein